jgi:hypothetical protein
VGADMTLVRPGPSPAAPVGEATRAGLERGVVGAGCVVDEVEQRVDAAGHQVTDEFGDVAVTREHVADAELAQERLILGQRRTEDAGAGTRGELDGQAADPSGRAGHE